MHQISSKLVPPLKLHIQNDYLEYLSNALGLCMFHYYPLFQVDRNILAHIVVGRPCHFFYSHKWQDRLIHTQ